MASTMKLGNVISARFGKKDSTKLEGYRADGGYATFLEVLGEKRDPASLVDEVKRSGLRGRGGAGFSTGMKWSFVPKDSPKPKYLCVNGDESEPGTFKDRYYLEREPHVFLEGMLIAAWAVEAETCFIYMQCLSC